MKQTTINAIRILSAEAIQKANSGHPGLPLGSAPIAYALFQNFLKFNNQDTKWDDRDRFVLSAGHGSMLDYSLLYLYGFGLTKEDLMNFRQLDSKTPGHPEYGHTVGIETTTGPLGQGIANAVGMAVAEAHLAAKFNREGFPVVDHYTYAICGDGCLEEGISYEACSFAGTHELGKLILFYDDNDITIEGNTDITFKEDIATRFAFALESLLSGVEKPLSPNDRLWYRKQFSVPASMQGKHILLHFGAVDWQCEVFINHTSVGTHTGGYCAFSLDITDYLTDGENELVVCVYDPTESGWQQRGKQVNDTHGFWYTATSGIWQTVWLEAVSDIYVTKLRFVPNIEGEFIEVKTEFNQEAEAEIHATVSFKNAVVFSGVIGKTAKIPLPNAVFWSPETPNLYDISLEILVNGVVTDTVTSYFGMRKFHIAKDEKGITRLFLNNKPYFQKGLLDQGYWPDGGMTPPTDEAMIFDIAEMKRLGFNMLRKHIKIEPLRWYYHCDRLGMIVWQDMMSGGKYIGDFYAGVLPNIGILRVKDNKYKVFSRTEKSWRDDFERELTEMIDLLYNTVSLYCWVPFNEAWGQFDALRICEYVRRLDNTRVIDHASGWYDQGGGDVQSMHKYILPIRMRKPDHRAFVITEFGGYSQKEAGHMWNPKKAFGYLMFKDKSSLTKAYAKLMKKQVIPLVAKGLSGTIYTQVSDVENEVNGIYTYDRAVLKLDEDTVIAINRQLTL